MLVSFLISQHKSDESVGDNKWNSREYWICVAKDFIEEKMGKQKRQILYFKIFKY